MRSAALLLGLSLFGCADRPPNGYVLVVTGAVVDETGAGIGGATVTFGSEPLGGAVTPVAACQADPDGTFTTALYGVDLDGNELRAIYDAPGRTQGWARYVLNLRSPTVAELDPGPLQTWEWTSRTLPSMELGSDVPSAHGAGQLVDLLGAPIAGASVELRRGWNAAAGDPVQQVVTTASDGGFGFDAVPGWWTAAVVPGSDWGAARFGILVKANANAATVGVAPGLDDLWMTAALTWGPAPADLDLHLMAPQKGTDGGVEYHVWAGAPRHPENDIVEAEAQLLRADADGMGPESVELVSEPDAGETRLDALDNTDVADPAASELGKGRAELQVWIAGEEPAFYTSSPGTLGTLWRPVEIADGVQYEVETYAEGVQSEDVDEL